jgi:hypothetical protein
MVARFTWDKAAAELLALVLDTELHRRRGPR